MKEIVMDRDDARPLEIDAPTPSQNYNRRDFVRTGLGVGFAAAVLPVLAQTAQHTDTRGLVAGEVTIAVADFQMPAYRAVPTGPGPWPVVLLASEIFGVHAYIADVARRLAHQGYLVVAPELFARQGDAGSYGEIAKLMSEVVSKVPDAQVLADLDACAAWATTQGGDLNRLGVSGFCWGGRISWLYAAHNPRLKAAVAWYGRLTGPVNERSPVHPLDVAAKLSAPVLGLYGGQDVGIPLAQVEQMKLGLAKGTKAAQASDFVVYPDAPHAFHADYRPSYRKEAAEDGWRRSLAWLRSHGVA
ncbi:dienelactone hydrolase family protein [Leptothrix ochracea]|uniref:dienelactone hydrolase family protein n=1 Tax=Leptothrix ochracea TaxID=735331 RepID=UPI0034E237BA